MSAGNACKVRTVESRLLNSLRQSDDGSAGIEQRLGHKGPQTSIGAGDECDFTFHRLLLDS